MKTGMVLATVATLASVVTANASETITYSYDEKGRLIRVLRAGSVNNNVLTLYVYDKANNRRTTTTTGSSNAPPP